MTAEASKTAVLLPEEESGRAPEGGDLYVLPQTSELAVEWAVLEPKSGRPDLWLAVPADTNPLRGPGDVWIAAAEPAGPLCLRCRFGAWIPRQVLATGRHTGRLSAPATREALETWRKATEGALRPSALAEEMAYDPEYREWERELLVPARAAVLAAATAAPSSVHRPRSLQPLLALAAALGLLCFGLGALSWQLRQQVQKLSVPILMGGSQELAVGTDNRGPTTLELRPKDEHLLVFIVLSEDAADYERYRVELSDRGGRLLWRSTEVKRGVIPELNLVIPRRFLARSEPPLRLQVFGIDPGGTHPLEEVTVRIKGIG
jgi:hypothetical protein